MSFSEPFIRRPVGTVLLAIGLVLTGLVAYMALPVASVPNIEPRSAFSGDLFPGEGRPASAMGSAAVGWVDILIHHFEADADPTHIQNRCISDRSKPDIERF